MTDNLALECRNLTRRYAGRAAVDGISLAVRPGRVTGLLGPSGCGKSTLLRLIAGLEAPDAGEIRIGGALVASAAVAVPPEARGVGLVFQDHALFPHLSVADNVGFGLSGLPRAARAARVAALLARFHIDHLAAAWPQRLSGGEAQRVAIARALARDPALLLLDEPFSGLDGQMRGAVRESLLADLADIGAAVVIVTHEPDEALAVGDDLALMAGGRLLQFGPPDVLLARPASAAAARLLGEVVVLACRVAAGRADTPLGPLPAPGVADGPAELVVRPAIIGPVADGAAAMVRAVRPSIGGHMVSADLAGTTLAFPVATRPPGVGETIQIGLTGPVAGIFPA